MENKKLINSVKSQIKEYIKSNPGSDSVDVLVHINHDALVIAEAVIELIDDNEISRVHSHGVTFKYIVHERSA
jgi:hypothetical protein